MRFHSDSTSKISTTLRAASASLRARFAARREESVGRAARQVVEQLEQRRLLAVVNAGEVGFFYNGNQSIRVTVAGEGSITLVGLTRPRPGNGGGRSLAELPMTVTGSGPTRQYNGGYNDGTSGQTQPPVYEIYSIYSGNSTSNTSVAITVYNPQTGASAPYSGSAGEIVTTMLDPGDTDNSFALANGGVFIGGRAGPEADELVQVYELTKNVSIATSPGVSLKKNAVLKPGVYVEGSFDNFWVGGTITGAVRISGSVDTFYAGNILTGDLMYGEQTQFIGTDNFFVGGDLRNLITAGGIGTMASAPQNFVPNTDIQVGGRIQQIKAGTNFRAAVDAVGGYDKNTSDGSTLTELESRTVTTANAASLGAAFNSFQFLNQGFANNDSFASPQILGSYYNTATKNGAQAQISGSINNATNVGDTADFYGMPLLAGQSTVVQVQSTGGLPVALQVYDPDGNIVFSDYSNQNAGTFANQAFTVKADQPGLWRLAIVPYRVLSRGVGTYTLTAYKLGEMAIGGVQSGNDLWMANANIGIRGRSADVGAVLAGGDLYSTYGLDPLSTDPSVLNPIVSDKGSVRSVEADNFGYLVDNTLYVDTFPTIFAKKSVGLVRTSVDRLYFNTYSRAGTDQPSRKLTIGGDYQVVETPGDFTGVLSANGGIGVIRVGSVGNDLRVGEPGYFNVNADNNGNDGVIGLIDVAGDLGTFTSGGPAISGGSGSNVRYMRVVGNAYRDRQFGTGNTIVVTRTDASQVVQDDSGALITITPIASQPYTSPADEVPVDPTNNGGLFGNTIVPSPFGNTTIPDPFGNGALIPTTDTNGDGVIDEDDLPDDVEPIDTSSTITIETYPTRIGGGSVILSITASDGVLISTAGNGAVAAGEIGEILTGSAGAAIVTNSDPTKPTTEETPAELASGQTLEVLMTGIRTSAYYIGSSSTTRANYTRVVNSTDGEIVNLNAADVGYLEANYLGVSRPAVNVTVEGRVSSADARYATIDPVVNQRNLIRIDNAIDVRSRGPLGNVAATGVIQNVVANSDNVNVKGLTEGIVGVVYAGSELRNVEIGEGLSTSGTGDFILAGLYSNDTIGTVTNAFGNGDLRGDVVARENIEAINIGGGGSIVDADIIQAGNVTTTITVNNITVGALGLGNEQFVSTIELVGSFDDGSGIGTINVEGKGGGIINTEVVALNVGLTTVGAGGFGVINSRFFSSGGGRMEGIQAAGLGIRGTIYTGGGTMGDIVATGGGRLASIDEYSLSVRGSTLGYYDVATGIGPNVANDLYLYLQTSKAEPSIIGVTNEGIIADTNIAASQSIGNIRAFDFRSFVNPLGTRPRDESFPMQINFGQSIGSITAKRDINGLRVTGGSLGSLVARDIKNFQLQSTGSVGTINAKRNILGTVNFNLVNEGTLNKLAVGGNMNGTLYAARGIDTIVVDGDVASQGISGGIYSALNIRSIRIGGDVREGAYIRARKRISGITINGDLQPTATIRANPFGTINIKGATQGKIQRK